MPQTDADMRILLVAPIAEQMGGTAMHVTALAGYLREQGHTVRLLDAKYTRNVPKGLKNMVFVAVSCLRSIVMRDYDIVHAHDIPAGIVMCVAPGRKKIVTLHGIYRTSLQSMYGSRAGGAAKRAESFVLKRTDAITTVSRDALLQYAGHAEQKGIIKHIPNFIDLSVINDVPPATQNIDVLWAGRLSKEKGTALLVKTFDSDALEEAGITLMIIGDGPEREEIVSLAVKRSNIQYAGKLDRRQVLAQMKSSKIFLNTSVSEGMSTAIMEAMACGSCIVATDITPNKELLDDCGILALANPEQFRSEMVRILADDGTIINNLAASAKNMVAQYDIHKVCGAYVTLYQQMLGGTAPE